MNGVEGGIMQCLKKVFLVGAVILVLTGMALPLHAAPAQGPTPKGRVDWFIQDPTPPPRPGGGSCAVPVPPVTRLELAGVARIVAGYLTRMLAHGGVVEPLSW